VKKKSVGDYSGIPYVCTLLNCLLWVVYGLPVVQFQVLVVSINAAGVFIEVIYLALYLINAQKKIKVRTFFTRLILHLHFLSPKLMEPISLEVATKRVDVESMVIS